MLISSSILWVGTLLVYVSSPNQKIIKKSCLKKLTYPIFALNIFLSVILLSQQYSSVIASLIVLAQVMVMWGSTVFILGHIKPDFILYMVSGCAVFSFISFLGAV